MTHSESLNELAAALAKAQAEIGGAERKSRNPHFKSQYADLASVWDAIRGPLTKHGLSVVQSPAVDGVLVSMTTLLLHTSGQWIRNTCQAHPRDLSPQSVASVVTYLRRYALAAMTSTYGDAPEDDAELAQGRGTDRRATPMTQPEEYDAWKAQMAEVALGGTKALARAFAESPTDIKRWARDCDLDAWEGIKGIAQQFDSAMVVPEPQAQKPVKRTAPKLPTLNDHLAHLKQVLAQREAAEAAILPREDADV